MKQQESRPALALVAVFPAALVPILMPVLRGFQTSDTFVGALIGALLGLSLLILILAIRRHQRHI